MIKTVCYLVIIAIETLNQAFVSVRPSTSEHLTQPSGLPALGLGQSLRGLGSDTTKPQFSVSIA